MAVWLSLCRGVAGPDWAVARAVCERGLRGAAHPGGGIGLVTVADTEVPSGLTAVVIASIPLWVVVLRLVHGDRAPRGAIAAVGVGFASLFVLLRPGGTPDSPEAGPVLLLLVLAAFLTAVGAVHSGKADMPLRVVARRTASSAVSR